MSAESEWQFVLIRKDGSPQKLNREEAIDLAAKIMDMAREKA